MPRICCFGDGPERNRRVTGQPRLLVLLVRFDHAKFNGYEAELRRSDVRAVFSKLDEPAMVQRYFAGRSGFFVEVGANHPENLSQTHSLESAGWTGVLIEPLAENCDLLRAQRSARVFQYACGSRTQHGTTAQISVAGEHGALSSLDVSRVHADKHKSFTDVRSVDVVTLDWLIEQTGRQKVDFVSIDVEGFEPEVIDGFSPARWFVDLVLVEDHARSNATHRAMTAKGYKRVRRTGDNSWYVPAALPFKVGVLGRWQLLRKYHLSRPVRLAKLALKR